MERERSWPPGALCPDQPGDALQEVRRRRPALPRTNDRRAHLPLLRGRRAGDRERLGRLPRHGGEHAAATRGDGVPHPEAAQAPRADRVRVERRGRDGDRPLLRLGDGPRGRVPARAVVRGRRHRRPRHRDQRPAAPRRGRHVRRAATIASMSGAGEASLQPISPEARGPPGPRRRRGPRRRAQGRVAPAGGSARAESSRPQPRAR